MEGDKLGKAILISLTYKAFLNNKFVLFLSCLDTRTLKQLGVKLENTISVFFCFRKFMSVIQTIIVTQNMNSLLAPECISVYKFKGSIRNTTLKKEFQQTNEQKWKEKVQMALCDICNPSHSKR